jgi:hypothetical protein
MRRRVAADRVVIGVVMALTFCIGAGCSFDRRWRNISHEAGAKNDAVAATGPASSDPLAGRWEGKWASEQTGHSGRLRAIVDRVDDKTYHIDYDGWFFGILRYTHGMNVTASRDVDDKIVHFKGQEDLGSIAGGVYRYDGTADGREFKSTYQSNDDHGRFEMQRPLD